MLESIGEGDIDRRPAPCQFDVTVEGRRPDIGADRDTPAVGFVTVLSSCGACCGKRQKTGVKGDKTNKSHDYQPTTIKVLALIKPIRL
ncbi:MAG: hypothetical protein P0Y50_12035 [Candidatus Brevundimonas colombiensis]|uniref:Uncharacterized protein n=1 Tax=Candidatus Brevundimonas colombiensis TaxID=3121376 RepID=A0AAJ5WZ90_9CAUL|nr:hypothetical protein [Brevundimonas sp.]WEK39267.1 MAG: hypothetical protein P0Y50_12035 [Brevundimonas sp.]